MIIRLRRHHVVCAIGFDGQGYNAAYTSNISRLVDGVLRQGNGEATLIHITDDADAICAPCPFRRGFGCETEALIDRLDTRHGAALGLSPGDRLTWGACLDRVQSRIRSDDLTTLCDGCSWLESGLCQAAVERLSVKRKGPPEGGPDHEAA